MFVGRLCYQMKSYPTYGILFRTLLITALFLSVSWANPQVVVSTVSADDVREHLRELDRLKSSGLDEESRQQLTELWSEASEIAELNDRCGEISLTEELDYSCSSFYEVKLPEFERRYTQLTGEVRMNALRLSLSMNDKRQAIEACYEAIPFGDFNLSKIYDVSGSFIPEPLDGGRTEVSYRISLRANSERKKAFEKVVASWYKTCKSQILRSDGSGQLAPLFEQRLESSEGFGVYALNRVSDRNYGYGSSSTQYKLVLKKNVSASYTLNGEEIFTHFFQWGADVLYFDFYSGTIRYSSSMESSDNGKVVFSESETKKGLYGKLRWTSSGGRGPLTFEDKTTEGIESKSPVNRHFDIDIRTSFLLGMEGTRQRLREDYPGVWNGEMDDVPDDSLIQVSWLMAGVLRIQGRFFFLGIGGGFAVNWLSTQVPTHVYGSTFDTESENLWTEFRPLVVGELGFFAGAVNEWEFGAREVYLSDPERPISYLSGFIGFYVFNLEVGWANCPNYFSQLYAGFTLRLPFSLFM